MTQSVVCVFCFKTIDGENDLNIDTLENRKEAADKFLKFLQRHLNSNIRHVNHESSASLLIRFGAELNENTPFDIYSCSDCNQLMSHFLDLYNQLKLIEIKLNWAMSKLVSVMSMASKVPSRAKAFNDSLKTTGDNGDNIYDATMKLKGIHDFRQDLITKCNQYYSGLLPRVMLKKQTDANKKKRNAIKEETFLNTSFSRTPGLNDQNVVEAMLLPDSVISLLLIAVLANNVLQLLSSLPTKTVRVPDQTLQSHLDPSLLTTGEVKIVVIENEEENNLHSEPKPFPSDSDDDDRSPGSCSDDVEKCVTTPELADLCSPITQENTSTSEVVDKSERGLRVRKRFYCNDCSESFATPSALLTHQQIHAQIITTKDDESNAEICDGQDPDHKKTEDEVNIVVIENEEKSNMNSEPELCPSDTDVRSPSPCLGANDKKIFVIVPKPTDRSSPVQENTIMSDDLDNCKRVLRARKRFYCNDCSESFATPSALLTHQQTHAQITTTKDVETDDEICDGRDPDHKKTEEEIIQYYANSQFQFSQRTKTDRGKFLIVRAQSNDIATIIKTEENNETCINTLSEYLSPALQRLTAALLHRPKFACELDDCREEFVFADRLESHSKLHGKFSCSLCAHVETYAPKMAEHVLTKHCTTISCNMKVGTFVSCPVLRCSSVDLPVEYHQTNFVFHYLTEHLNLDVSSVGCPICHYTKSSGALSAHNHFRTFHDIFNMKAKEVRQCKLCLAFFCATSKLNSHMLAFHNQMLTSCPDCDETFEGVYGYFHHYRKCKGKNTDSFKHCCSYPNCNKKFAGLSGLKQHKKVCNFNPGGFWHNCSKCKQQFRQKRELERHLQSHKQQIRRPKSYLPLKACMLCGKRVNNYTNHMKWHSGPGSWKHKCSECGIKFHNSKQLTSHMERHAKDLPFVCKFCGARYSRAGFLRIHHSKSCSSSPSTSSVAVNLQQNPREYQIPKKGEDDENSQTGLEPQINSGFLNCAKNPDHNQCMTEVNHSKKTEEEIIQHYATTQFEYFREAKTNNDEGEYIICYNQTATDSTLIEGSPNAIIKTLSQCLSPAQQSLAAALLHQPKFLCKINNCWERFVFEDQFESHSKLHGEFMCDLCSHVETYAPKMSEHVLTKHCSTISSSNASGTYVSCPIPTCACLPSVVEFYQTNYVFHYLTEHLNLDVSSIGCPICHYTSPNGALYRHNHFNTFHGIFGKKREDVIWCDICPAFFCSNNKLNLHMLAYHNQAPVTCPDCRKTFKSKTGIFQHRLWCKSRNRDSFQHKCSFPNCNKTFESSFGLVRHQKTCTFNPEGTWLDCTKCKRRFREEEQLKRHLEFHKKAVEQQRKNSHKTKICDVCGKVVSMQYFSRHMRVHAGPESWKHLCPECGKKCFDVPKLREHMRTHTKDVSFVCQFCGVKYAHAHNLRLHVNKKHGHNDNNSLGRTPSDNSTPGVKHL